MAQRADFIHKRAVVVIETLFVKRMGASKSSNLRIVGKIIETDRTAVTISSNVFIFIFIFTVGRVLKKERKIYTRQDRR